MTSRTRSKMQTEKVCYITGATENLELHHCLNGAYRKKCDQDGLYVYLYSLVHFAIHNVPGGNVIRLWLKQKAQIAYEKDHTRREFIERYGKNYLCIKPKRYEDILKYTASLIEKLR